MVPFERSNSANSHDAWLLEVLNWRISGMANNKRVTAATARSGAAGDTEYDAASFRPTVKAPPHTPQAEAKPGAAEPLRQ